VRNAHSSGNVELSVIYFNTTCSLAELSKTAHF
jgi:hypothetical protein